MQIDGWVSLWQSLEKSCFMSVWSFSQSPVWKLCTVAAPWHVMSPCMHLTFTTCSLPPILLPPRLTVKQPESGLGILLVQHVLRAKVLMTSSFKNFYMHALQGHRLVPSGTDSQLLFRQKQWHGTAGIHHKCNHQVMPPLSSFNLIFLNCQ